MPKTNYIAYQRFVVTEKMRKVLNQRLFYIMAERHFFFLLMSYLNLVFSIIGYRV